MTQAANLGALGTNATSTGGLTGANLGTPSALVLTNATGLGRAAMPAGSVIQVVNATNGTEQYTTSASDVETSVVATITPYYATSKILVIATAGGLYINASDTQANYYVYRGGTLVGVLMDSMQCVATGMTTFRLPTCTFTKLDSPATTSATTYKFWMSRRTGSGTIGINSYGSTAPASGFTLMEIAQ
jgi:hypothetical protein